MFVVAHRGASGSAPENTLAALQRAVSLGATWAEVDVQRTSDDVLVLVHDDSWLRTAGRDVAVRDLAWSAVRELDAGSWFDRRFRGEHPPDLASTLALCAQGLQLNLEIKSPENDPGLGMAVVDAVRSAGVAASVLLTSFDARLIETLTDQAPDLACGYLAARQPLGSHPRVATWVLLAERILADPQVVGAARQSGRHVWAWTVDEVDVATRLAELGVEAVITNYPERFLGRPDVEGAPPVAPRTPPRT